MSSTPPKFILYIPQLFQPLKLWHQDFGFTPSTPVFSSLFQTIKPYNTSSLGFERSLYTTLGLPITNELPIARYRYLQGDNETSGQWKTLICADPVHCEVGMNDITLTGTVDDLTTQDSMELISQLNAHFAEDGLSFILDKNNHWYLALSDHEMISSSPLEDVRGKNIFSYLPKSDTKNWQQIHNEVQMLLHISNLNQSREIAGLPTVNSLWFWGGGEEISFPITKHKSIYGGNTDNSTIGASFAKASKSTWKALPETSDDLIDSVLNNQKTDELDTIVILDQLIDPSLSDDLTEWQQQVSAIEEQYIKPFMDCWLTGHINIEFDTCNGQRITPLKDSVWHTLYKKVMKPSPKPLFDIKL